VPRKFSGRGFSDILKIPNIDTENKARVLSFFREAKAASSPYYEFLCYWKILEIYGEKKGKWSSNKTKNWINDTIKRNKWIIKHSHFQEEKLENETVGEYLNKTCRVAIAHTMPSIRKYELKPDSGESVMKVNVANRVMELLVGIFIKKELDLQDESANYLFLKKKKGKVIPVFEPGLKI